METLSPSTAAAERVGATARMHLPCLATALLIMVGGTVYPLVMTDATGRADHLLASWLAWAMSAGFVRGVGFVPRATPWRWLFSGWACALALALAGLTRLLH